MNLKQLAMKLRAAANLIDELFEDEAPVHKKKYRKSAKQKAKEAKKRPYHKTKWVFTKARRENLKRMQEARRAKKD